MGNFIRMDLKPHFNHQAIAWGVEGNHYEGSEVRGLGLDHLLFRKQPQFDVNKEIRVKSIPFQFPDHAAGQGFDNVRCNEQRIPMNGEKIIKIHLLGCCVFGSYKDQMKLTYSDYSSEQPDFAFFGWGQTGSGGDEHQFIFEREVLADNKVAVLEGLNTNQQKVGFTYYCSTLRNTDSHLVSIEFPDNYFMHIFAMTLEMVVE